MINLATWMQRVTSSVDQVLDDFENRFGYPPDVNEIVVGSGQAGSMLNSELGDRARIPSSVVEFFNGIEEVTLPDIWNGYFLGPVPRAIAAYEQREPRWVVRDGEQIEILVVGSDGGGAIYVVELQDAGQVCRLEEVAIVDGVARNAREHQNQILAEDFSSFLDLFAQQLESYAVSGAPPRL